MNPLSAGIGVGMAAAPVAARPAPGRPSDASTSAESDPALLALAALQGGMPLREPAPPLPPTASGAGAGATPAAAPQDGMARQHALKVLQESTGVPAGMASLLPSAGSMAQAMHAALAAGSESVRADMGHKKFGDVRAAPALAPPGPGQLAQASVTTMLAALANPQSLRTSITASVEGGHAGDRAGAAILAVKRTHAATTGGVVDTPAGSPEAPAHDAGASTLPVMPASGAPELDVADIQPAARVPAAPERALLDALGERINLQARQGVHSAVVRLDPASAGSVLIELRHEAGALHVRLSASQADVARQLKSISEGLRHELSTNRFGDVTVQVGQDRPGDRGGRQQERHDPSPQRQAEPGRALGAGDADPFFGAEWARLRSLRNTSV